MITELYEQYGPNGREQIECDHWATTTTAYTCITQHTQERCDDADVRRAAYVGISNAQSGLAHPGGAGRPLRHLRLEAVPHLG